MIGKGEYEARFRPSRVLFTITVPVEFEEERDASESLEAGWWVFLGFAVVYISELSSPGEILGSCTMSSDDRPESSSMRSSMELVLVRGLGVIPCVGV